MTRSSRAPPPGPLGRRIAQAQAEQNKELGFRPCAARSVIGGGRDTSRRAAGIGLLTGLGLRVNREESRSRARARPTVEERPWAVGVRPVRPCDFPRRWTFYATVAPATPASPTGAARAWSSTSASSARSCNDFTVSLRVYESLRQPAHPTEGAGPERLRGQLRVRLDLLTPPPDGTQCRWQDSPSRCCSQFPDSARFRMGIIRRWKPGSPAGGEISPVGRADGAQRQVNGEGHMGPGRDRTPLDGGSHGTVVPPSR